MRTFTVEIVSHDNIDRFVSLIQYGNVPLEAAARNGHTKTVQKLLEAGANVNYQNKVMTVNVQLPCK